MVKKIFLFGATLAMALSMVGTALAGHANLDTHCENEAHLGGEYDDGGTTSNNNHSVADDDTCTVTEVGPEEQVGKSKSERSTKNTKQTISEDVYETENPNGNNWTWQDEPSESTTTTCVNNKGKGNRTNACPE